MEQQINTTQFIEIKLDNHEKLKKGGSHPYGKNITTRLDFGNLKGVAHISFQLH